MFATPAHPASLLQRAEKASRGRGVGAFEIEQGEEVDRSKVGIKRRRRANLRPHPEIGAEQARQGGKREIAVRRLRQRVSREGDRAQRLRGELAAPLRFAERRPAVGGRLRVERTAADEVTASGAVRVFGNGLPEEQDDRRRAVVAVDAGAAQFEEPVGLRKVRSEVEFPGAVETAARARAALEAVGPDHATGTLVEHQQMLHHVIKLIVTQSVGRRRAGAMAEFKVENLVPQAQGAPHLGRVPGQSDLVTGVAPSCGQPTGHRGHGKEKGTSHPVLGRTRPAFLTSKSVIASRLGAVHSDRMTNGDPGLPAGAEAWLDEHGDALFRYAMARVRTRETAEDLVQDTLLAALRGRFDGRSSVRTWLTGILKNKIIDYYRKKGRETPFTDLARTGEENSGKFDAEGFWDHDHGPREWTPPSDEVLHREEFWQVLRQCLDKLPPRMAEVFRLRVVEEVPSPEVCEVAHVSEGNLWVLLHRARAGLRDCFEQNWFGHAADSP